MKAWAGFVKQNGIYEMAEHTARIVGEGEGARLEHYINGDLRATVPPEGFADYAVQWPQVAELVGVAEPVIVGPERTAQQSERDDEHYPE